jgi:hypothetical protein
MSALLQKRLKEHLEAALAPLKLAGAPLPSEEGNVSDASCPPHVFVGDMPPKRKDKALRDVPCVLLIPLTGHHEVEEGYTEAVSVIVLVCVVFNPEEGDAEGGEADLAALLSAITGALLPCAQGVPLAKRFVLEPDSKGKLLSWVKGEEQPRPFLQATMTSHWRYKGWE